jgi:hypothetical protein
MPTDQDEVFENGVVVSSMPRTVSDEEVERRGTNDRLRAAYPLLRQWADDAAGAVGNWDGWTTAQRFAALKTVVDRFGKLADGLADLLLRER